MKILVTGGAGYIGSHTVRHLVESGYDVWVYDNLCKGHREAVPEGRLIVGELADTPLIARTLREKQIEAVMHFAAFAEVGDSVRNPQIYYRNNVIDALRLMDGMLEANVKKFVFSSTTATYGVPDQVPITEQEWQDPINPYGFTKLVIEHALADYARAYDWGYAALRYFNAAGAHPSGEIGESHDPESHLIPIILQVAMGQRESITVFGNDYPTPDGTCIRDYIHVDDLATAHRLALEKLEPGSGLKLNLGTGKGCSVREIIDACRRVTGHPIPEVIGERRPGDPAELVADSSLAQRTLGWTPQYTDVEQIIRTAWNWHQNHPQGY
jgi:UDP-glucose 4-epimerase